MNAFWEATGKLVPSYVVMERSLREFLDSAITEKLDDCALYNDVVLLHYDRSNKIITIAFRESEDELFGAVTLLFNRLTKFLEGSGALRFEAITESWIKKNCPKPPSV